LTGHALIMLILLRKSVRRSGLLGVAVKSLAAAGGMGLAVYGSAQGVAALLGGEGLRGWLAQVGAGAVVGVLAYGILITLFRVEEWATLRRAVARRLRRRVRIPNSHE